MPGRCMHVCKHEQRTACKITYLLSTPVRCANCNGAERPAPVTTLAELERRGGSFITALFPLFEEAWETSEYCTDKLGLIKKKGRCAARMCM